VTSIWHEKVKEDSEQAKKFSVDHTNHGNPIIPVILVLTLNRKKEKSARQKFQKIII